MKLPVIITREPGGTIGAEKIRKIILTDYFHLNSKEQFDKYTDTLLYLAARNEHIQKTKKPAILKKKIILCDRFVDSTLAYQVYGKKVNKNLVDLVHKRILGKIKPNLTFLLKLNVNEAIKRINKRKVINRYDRLTKKFYVKAQKGYLNLAKKNKKRYIVLDTSRNIKDIEKAIYDNFLRTFRK